MKRMKLKTGAAFNRVSIDDFSFCIFNISISLSMTGQLKQQPLHAVATCSEICWCFNSSFASAQLQTWVWRCVARHCRWRHLCLGVDVAAGDCRVINLQIHII